MVCPNPECEEFALSVVLYRSEYDPRQGRRTGDKVGEWRLVPPSEAKGYPEYIPQAIRDDYTEACLVKELSPKASATLSRRSLQGMIRGFWDVSAPNLYKKTEAIKDKLDPTTWSAIDSVRSVGNIGAHMEKDINVIIDVDPQEAALLIWLIETLIEDWYINRQEREERLKQITSVAEAKKREQEEFSGSRE